ncbi:hypothetical protein EYF80_001402 [Liparis tanakae]|uniref:Uncharacterized protein n=1 Tax=Liparis tanakae TaxID=230148 RepID=A0A4Z2JD70_9TELE|nr:hypothetical protein EYF80_001402 [Liparis tanakae]
MCHMECVSLLRGESEDIKKKGLMMPSLSRSEPHYGGYVSRPEGMEGSQTAVSSLTAHKVGLRQHRKYVLLPYSILSLASAAGWLTISQLLSLIGNQSAADAAGIKRAELEQNGKE